METENEKPTEDNAPIEALCEVLDYLWAGELESYRERPTEGHIFNELALVANWLNGGDWRPADYARAWDDVPELGWRAAGHASRPRPPGPVPAGPADGPEAEWVWDGYGSRYRIRGRGPTIQVIVGWDRPLATYFAQVWDVPVAATHHEEGRLLLWRGTSQEDVPDVSGLADAMAPFVALPPSLAAKLEADLGDPESCTRGPAEGEAPGDGGFATFEEDDLTFAYTRKQAVEDGVLIDVTAAAREAGFAVPLAVTPGAWSGCVRPTDGASGEDEAHRLREVLTTLRDAIWRTLDWGRVDFAVPRRGGDADGTPPSFPLRAVCGLDAEAEPLVVVMLPREA